MKLHRVALFLALAVPLTSSSPALAQPTAYPADSVFQATKCSAINSFDPLADAGIALGARDIVGDSNYPALLVHDDGTFIYFRLRLEATPLTGGTSKPLLQHGWAIGLDTNKSKADMEYAIIADGVSETVKLVRVSNGATLLTLQPTRDAANSAKYVQVKQVTDGSNFGADTDYYLTIAVPMSAVAQATAGDPSPITWGSSFHLWAATSNTGTDLNGDFMCWNDSAGPVSLLVAAAGPLTLGSSCTDQVKNGNETDVDCGGSCPGCGLTKACSSNTDCLSALCSPAKKCASPCPSAADGNDCDGDGLVNIIEDKNGNGVVDPGETNRNNPDTDGDGISDGIEDKNKNGVVDPGETSPLNPDSDGDGLKDGVEDKNKNNVVDPGETSPLKADSDGDGISDGVEDKNKNGVVDPGETSPLLADSDGDGLSDGVEDKNKNGVVDPGETDPLKADSDGDGLKDGEEDKNKNGVVDAGETDPLNPDTDGGGESDGSEVLITGHNPLDPSDDNQVAPDAGPKPDGAPKPDLIVAADQRPGDLSPAADGVVVLDRGPAPEAGADAFRPSEAGTDAGPASDGPGPGPEAGETGIYLYGGGCGCSSTAEPGSGTLAGLLLGLGLLMVRRRRRGKSGLLLLLTLVVLAGPAQAQVVRLPALNFQPAASPINFYVTESGLTLGNWVPSMGLFFNYAHTPLQIWGGSDRDTVAELISYQVNMDVLVAIGISRWFELGLGLPVTLAQDSDPEAVQMGMLSQAVSAGVGDLRLIPKVSFLRHQHLALALAVPVTFPTGNRDYLLGDDSVTISPKAVATLQTRFIDVGVNVGVRIRAMQNARVSDAQQEVVVNDDLLVSAGVRVPLWRERIDLIGDGYLSMAFEEQNEEEIPFEILGGLRFYLPAGFVGNLGAGPGVTRGIGTPTFRVFAGVSYAHRPDPARDPSPADRDGDGIPDHSDSCPAEPEDRDGFQDEDGCPDLDNDGDGIPDAQDKCPMEAEDKDGYQDEDGCPDPDNDGDGILDAQDKCPLQAEDKDGFEDEDGCPDLDNDKDGIADLKDRCPDQPETFNGVDDEDGCPDQGTGGVQVAAGKITVPPVFFATGKDVILAQSQATLRQVADTIKKNAWIKRIRVEGHTDDRGSVELNNDLSQRRADSVVKFLVDQGVEAGRLEAQGYGPGRPITSNQTEAGRAKNRRVEFIIVDPKM